MKLTNSFVDSSPDDYRVLSTKDDVFILSSGLFPSEKINPELVRHLINMGNCIENPALTHELQKTLPIPTFEQSKSFSNILCLDEKYIADAAKESSKLLLWQQGVKEGQKGFSLNVDWNPGNPGIVPGLVIGGLLTPINRVDGKDCFILPNFMQGIAHEFAGALAHQEAAHPGKEIFGFDFTYHQSIVEFMQSQRGTFLHRDPDEWDIIEPENDPKNDPLAFARAIYLFSDPFAMDTKAIKGINARRAYAEIGLETPDDYDEKSPALLEALVLKECQNGTAQIAEGKSGFGTLITAATLHGGVENMIPTPMRRTFLRITPLHKKPEMY